MFDRLRCKARVAYNYRPEDALCNDLLLIWLGGNDHVTYDNGLSANVSGKVGVIKFDDGDHVTFLDKNAVAIAKNISEYLR